MTHRNVVGRWANAFLVACLMVILCISVRAQESSPVNALRRLVSDSGGMQLPAIKVTGPIALTTPLRDPAHGYPYNSTPLDLAKHAYMEEEFFIEGQASSYNTPPGLIGSVKDGNHPFKIRIVVRRPMSATKFNGTVVVEWYNVSQGHDGEYDWFQSAEQMLAGAYAWVGVSNQKVGVNSLKEWSPTRYGTLDVTAEVTPHHLRRHRVVIAPANACELWPSSASVG